MVQGSNPGGGEILRTHPDQPWGPPSLLYSWYRVSFPGVKRPGCGVNHPPSSSAGVKERVELYLYSHSGSSWPFLGRTLPFFTFFCSFYGNSYNCCAQKDCSSSSQQPASLFLSCLTSISFAHRFIMPC
jgi:hypothetical protein